MIKEFFAKLTSWNAERNPGWDKAKTENQIERSRKEAQQQREDAEERRQASLRAVPEEERLRRLKEDVEGTVGQRDKAA